MTNARYLSLYFIGLAGIAGCSRGVPEAAAEQLQAPLPVRVAAVDRGPVSRPVQATGTVHVKNAMDLSFKVGGVLASIPVEKGTVVKRGQVLAQLDATEIKARASQAREAALQAERDLARVSKLSASGALPPVQLETAETQASIARSAETAAAFDARHAVIVAPDDGWIDARLASAGEVIAPGRPVLHLSGRSKGWVVRVALPDRDVLRVAVGDAATIALDATSPPANAPLSGKITEIATVATAETGTFDVEVRFDSAPGFLRAGLTARVSVEKLERPAATVPLSAVVDGNGQRAAVFAVGNQHAARVPVSVAFLYRDRAALEGLPADVTEVVSDGAPSLVDGAAVRVVP